MDAHKKINSLIWEKERKEAEVELIKMATENIGGFIDHCRTLGFKLGIKFGFWLGITVAFIIYLIAR